MNKLADLRTGKIGDTFNQHGEQVFSVSLEQGTDVKIIGVQGLAGRDGLGSSQLQIVIPFNYGTLPVSIIDKAKVSGKLASFGLDVIEPFEHPTTLSIGTENDHQVILPKEDYGLNSPAGTQIEIDLSGEGAEVSASTQYYLYLFSANTNMVGRAKLTLQLAT